jgi:hypothetical protein
MWSRPILVVAASALGLWSGAVEAEPGRSLRLLGETQGLGEGAPRRFVLDVEVAPGDAPFKSDVSGWLAVLPPETGSGEVSGSCVEEACAISVDLDDGKLSLTGPLGAARASTGRARYGDEGPTGQASFTPLAGAVPEVGELAAPDAVTASELREILMWNGSPTGFSNFESEGAPSDFERDALAVWQGSNDRPATGLVAAADLQALRDGARAEKAKGGWTVIGDPALGWSAGYPAALLPQASRAGAEQRFASADGKALLVIAVEPPRSDEAFDALVEEETASRPEREDVGYTRVNGDMEVSYTEKGVRTLRAWHARRGGLARVTFTYPAGDDAWAMYDDILRRSLKVTDALKAE